jgi:hypothetical protein
MVWQLGLPPNFWGVCTVVGADVCVEGPVDVKHHLHHLPASVVLHVSQCFGHSFGSWNSGSVDTAYA